MTHSNKEEINSNPDLFDDEWDERIKNSGCYDENSNLQNCYSEKKDWRKCATEIEAFKSCWSKKGYTRS